jgi:hypothetical protein
MIKEITAALFIAVFVLVAAFAGNVSAQQDQRQTPAVAQGGSPADAVKAATTSPGATGQLDPKSLIGEWKGTWSHPVWRSGAVSLRGESIQNGALVGSMDIVSSDTGCATQKQLNAPIQNSGGVISISFSCGKIAYTLKLEGEKSLIGNAAGPRATTSVSLTKQEN